MHDSPFVDVILSHQSMLAFYFIPVQQEIQRAAEEIWLRLLSRRRKDLEDAYKISLFKEKGDGEERMKMEDIDPLWEEAMRKTWQAFLGLCS